MSIHKLSAGSGYDYLTRQVARHDATATGHTGLADYYSAKGEAPGVWLGSGLAGITGLNEGDPVTAEQMRRLFGAGLHPLGDQLAEDLGHGATAKDYDAVERLGTPFPIYAGSAVSPFRVEVARRIEALNRAQGRPAGAAVPLADRARIRTEVATETFRTEHGRDPVDAREVAATIAKHSRPASTAVAGYDLTFSPVKSVSTLWAIADRTMAERIEAAHQAAVKDALSFIEDRALFTRTGHGGVQQVDVCGLVATAFTHRDSRAGDPDLHTHVAVANKVQTHDGRWLSIDGRVLFKATVVASETYNTALERHLRPLGLAFAERPGGDPRKRPVREVVGVDPRLNARWSSRRADIEVRRGELSAQFQAAHGRPPTPVESIQLAQQATLETRDAKHEPRSLAQQRGTWHGEALQVLGGPAQLNAMVSAARSGVSTTPREGRVSEQWVQNTALRILDTVERSRSAWQVWHVRAEAQRRVRGMDVSAAGVTRVVDALTTATLRRSIALTPAPAPESITEPAPLRRRDGASVYTVVEAELHTSTRILQAEQRIVAAAGRYDGRAVAATAADLALLASTANGVHLNAGQVTLVRSMATSGARVQLGIAPAGTGKTTAMRALTAAWEESGGTVLGLAPSAAAAAALREQTGTTTDTLAKLTWSLLHSPTSLPDWARAIDRDTLVVIDEAGMADTLSLDTAVRFVTKRGGSVRLIGDDQQLAAIGAGGVLRDIAVTHGALRLVELMRFANPAEGAASLALREGRPEALGFYLDHSRVHVGDLATMTDDVFDAWASDRRRGLDAIMLAPTRDLVAELNQRARAHRIREDTGQTDTSLPLADGNQAGVGDLVITRANNRRLRLTATDWVKNGDRWTVLALPGDGRLRVRHTGTGLRVTLPAPYVAESTELGYATTVHGAQGVTADVMHGLATGAESRQQLYTMLTRGRHANHVYLQVVGDGDEHDLTRPDTIAPPTATDLLEAILARDDSPVSASTIGRDQGDPARLLGQATARYVDALHTAAADRLGSAGLDRLDATAERLVPGMGDAPAWPALRAHLTLLAAHGIDPPDALREAVVCRELTTAGDPAAVLGWRLDETGLRNAGPGPLPWTPGIPAVLAEDPQWGPYLAQRAELVRDLTGQVAARAATGPTPAWAPPGAARPADDVLAQVAVWRAARQIPEADRRPTGPPCPQRAPALHQRALRAQLSDRSPALAEWGPLIQALSPAARADAFAPVLAERLAAVSRAGIPAAEPLRYAATTGPLPDDHAAAALWWRVAAHLSPDVAAGVDEPPALTRPWVPALVDAVGEERVKFMQASPWWDALASSVDHAQQRGWQVKDLVAAAHLAGGGGDDIPDLLWRIDVVTDPPVPEENREVPAAQPPDDLLALNQVAPAWAPTQAEIDAHDLGRARTNEALETPEQRWAPFAVSLDPRLTHDAEWPMLAQRMQHIHDFGHDIPTLCRIAVEAEPLGDHPALDLYFGMLDALPPRPRQESPRRRPSPPSPTPMTDIPYRSGRDRSRGPSIGR